MALALTLAIPHTQHGSTRSVSTHLTGLEDLQTSSWQLQPLLPVACCRLWTQRVTNSGSSDWAGSCVLQYYCNAVAPLGCSASESWSEMVAVSTQDVAEPVHRAVSIAELSILHVALICIQTLVSWNRPARRRLPSTETRVLRCVS